MEFWVSLYAADRRCGGCGIIVGSELGLAANTSIGGSRAGCGATVISAFFFG